MPELDEAIDLVAQYFSRCSNYPRGEQGGKQIHALAKGLMHAAEITGAIMADIAQRCADETEFVPTDALMLRLARQVAPYRSPESEPINRGERCPVCDGTGWETVYALHTYESGPYHNFKRKEPISQETAERILPNLDAQKQMIYTGAKRCKCGATPMADRGIGR